MSRLPVRLALVLACITAIGAAGYLIWSSEQRARAADASARAFDEAARRAIASAAELRAAQQAYVAAGQGEEFWFARVATLIKDFDEVLSVLKPHATAPESTLAIDEAAGAMQDFLQVDTRARELVRGGSSVQASDVIFADGYDLTRKASMAVSRAHTAERVARDAAAASSRRQEALAAVGAGLLSVVGLATLGVTRRRPLDPPQQASRSFEPPAPVSAETLDDLHDFGLIAVANRAAPSAPEVRPDLTAMASLCSDLARVADTKALPALIERAATILDAAGIVLWIADPDGRELTPTLVQGYPPYVASRFGTLPREAANLTASAFRTGLLQSMLGDAVSNGAIAAPLVTAGGCVGVMAAEMKNGGERQENLLAAAGILASQLSTLVGPPAARARAEAAG